MWEWTALCWKWTQIIHKERGIGFTFTQSNCPQKRSRKVESLIACDFRPERLVEGPTTLSRVRAENDWDDRKTKKWSWFGNRKELDWMQIWVEYHEERTSIPQPKQKWPRVCHRCCQRGEENAWKRTSYPQILITTTIRIEYNEIGL